MKGSPAHARHVKHPIPIDPAERVIPPRVENANVLRRLLRLCFPSKSALLIAVFTCVVVPASLVGIHIHENPKLSPIDEGAHLDYVTRIEQGSMPRLGQRLQPSTLRVTACAGFVLNVKLPPCDAHKLTPQEFPGGGYQYEAQQPPTYYAVTVPFRLFFFSVLGVSDPDATRLVGVLCPVDAALDQRLHRLRLDPRRVRLERTRPQVAARREFRVGPLGAAVGMLYGAKQLLLQHVGGLLVELLVRLAQCRQRLGDLFDRDRQIAQYLLSALSGRV